MAGGFVRMNENKGQRPGPKTTKSLESISSLNYREAEPRMLTVHPTPNTVSTFHGFWCLLLDEGSIMHAEILIQDERRKKSFRRKGTEESSKAEALCG